MHVPKGTQCTPAEHIVRGRMVQDGAFCIPDALLREARQRIDAAGAVMPNDAATDPHHQTLVALPSTVGGTDYFPASALAFYQQQVDLIEKPRFELTEPASPLPPTIGVLLSPVSGAQYFASISGVIIASIPLAGETIPDCASCEGFTHEMMHQSLDPVVFNGEDYGLHEGLASGKDQLIYIALYAANPASFKETVPITSTSVAANDQYNNARPLVFGGANTDGASDFYNNLWNDYEGPHTLILLMIDRLGGNFVKLDDAINRDLPQTRADFLALLDKEFPGVTVDGVTLSTFMQQDVTAVADGEPGESWFGIRSAGGADWVRYSAVGNGEDWPFNPQGYWPVYATWTTNSSGSVIPVQTDGTVIWGVKDASNRWLVSDQVSPLYVIDAMNLGRNQVLNPGLTGGNQYYLNYPEQALTIVACLMDSTTGTCSTDPRLNDLDQFPILNKEELNPGDVAVIDNHGGWGTLSPTCSLTVLKPAGNVTVESYPGLCIFRNIPQNADGSFEDLTITDPDKVHIRTFTPDPRQPIEHVFRKRLESVPGWIAESPTGPAIEEITPGRAYTLYGSYLCLGDPFYPTAVRRQAAPTEGCVATPANDQGRTIVRFTAPDGNTFDAGITYADMGRVSLVVPRGLEQYLGKTVKLTVIVNGVPSLRSLTFSVGLTHHPSRGSPGRGSIKRTIFETATGR